MLFRSVAHGLLGTHVRRRADGDARRGQALVALRGPRDAEVGYERAPAGRLDQDVGGLDVTVDHAVRVRVRQRVGHLAQHAPDERDVGPRFAHEAQREGLAIHEAHREVDDPADVVDRVDRDDVGMRELRCELRLTHEPRAHVGPECELRGQHLEGNVAAQARVAGAVYHGHAPAADFLLDRECGADGLLDRGYEVVAVDNLLTGRRTNLVTLEGRPGFTFLEHDVIDGIPVDGPVDAVLHFASPASPPEYLRMPFETLDVGSIGTRHALELARTHGARFLLASTSEIYGDPLVHPQPETYWGNVNSVGPRSVYDEAKRFAEAMTMAYHRYHGVDTRIVRIFNTYGPRMRPRDGRVVSNFIVQALNGEPLTIYGDGSQTRSFCYVDDEVEGIYRLFMRGDSQPTNIGNPVEFTVRQLAELVIALTGTTSAIVQQPLPEDDPKVRQPDITRARTTLGWEPAVPLREGVDRTIAYFRGLMGTPRMSGVA